MSSLRVMTFNVRYDKPEDGGDGWPQRRDLVAGTIRYHAPDVVGLQEPDRAQLSDLERALPGYEWVGKSRRAGPGEGEFAPVGYRTARFDLAETETFWLSETPHDPGSVGWDAAHPRIATWARLREDGADPLVVANTHLDHEGARARAAGASLLADRLGTLAAGAHVVLTGDLNCGPDGPAYDRLDGVDLGADRRLVAAETVAAHDHGPDTTRTDFHDLLPDRKIDHVFVEAAADAGAYAVCTDRDDARYPSDHLPVVVDLTLP